MNHASRVRPILYWAVPAVLLLLGSALSFLALYEGELRPQLKILFTSGLTGAAVSAAVNDDLAGYLLSKPYRKDELERRVRSALDGIDLWGP
jgi:hypothetical protein